MDNYKRYQAHTESPADFILWSGISALSASLKRNVYIDKIDYKLYPNQYIILVGPPGVGKGTAIKPAVTIAKEAGTVNYLSDRITAERVIEKLATGFQTTVSTTAGVKLGMESSATIISKELPVFLSASEWMLPLLCQLWDENEFEYETKNKGSNHIKDLCVGLIAGCVPDYIRRINKDAVSAITGGFTARCLFVYATEKSQSIPWADNIVKTQHKQLHSELMSDLQYINSSLIGEFQLTPDAMDYWKSFYKANDQKNSRFEQEVIINFRSRMPTHMLKTAMVLSVSEGDSLIIEKRHIEEAFLLIDKICKNLVLTFRAVGESNLASATSKVLDFLEHKGMCSRGEILKVMYKDVTDEDLTRILTTLLTMGAVTETVQGGRFYYTYV